MKKTVNCLIEIVSPVHIGCDEVYEPTSFVVDENHLIDFEPLVFMADLEPAEKEQFSNICRKGTVESILELYKFFQNKTATGRKVDLCPAFMTHYRSTLNLPAHNSRKIQNELNRFSIQRTAFRRSDGRPYLPGSSIKGVLRTGYLNHKCQGKKVYLQGERKNAGALIEKKLLDFQRIDEDPFSQVKVSDFQPVGEARTKIVYAVNQKKKSSPKDARGPYQILEIIQPGAIFQGTVEVRENPAGAKDPAFNPDIKDPIQLEALLQGAGDFYFNENQRENRELAAVRIPSVQVNGVTNTLLSPEKVCIPLRVGRHSGAESVTIDGNRDIKIMLGNRKSTYMDHATTFWLSSEKSTEAKKTPPESLMPFGWICIQPFSSEQVKDIEKLEQVYFDKVSRKKKEEIQILQDQQQKEKEEKERLLKQKEKLERKQKETEALKAQLKTMSPEELFLFELKQGDILEEKVNIAFKKIDDTPESHKKLVAIGIKKYWQEKHLWTKKEVGGRWRKIRDRNNKLDAIIGD